MSRDTAPPLHPHMISATMGVFLKIPAQHGCEENPIGEYFYIPGTQPNEQCQSCQTNYDLTRSHIAMKKHPWGS